MTTNEAMTLLRDVLDNIEKCDMGAVEVLAEAKQAVRDWFGASDDYDDEPADIDDDSFTDPYTGGSYGPEYYGDVEYL